MMTRAQQIRRGVREAYSDASDRPTDKHAFPVGRAFAVDVGYSPDTLARMPSLAVDAFAGVSNVAEFADLAPGMRVLDLGCGAGLDALIAAERVGPDGRVYGVDYSESMLVRARMASREAGASHLEYTLAEAETLPMADRTFDVALVNGIFNLNPSRDALFSELGRVLRPGGALFAAELILVDPLPEGFACDTNNWFS